MTPRIPPPGGVAANLGPTESKANRPMGTGRSLSIASYTILSRLAISSHPSTSDEALFALFLPQGSLALWLGGSCCCSARCSSPPPVTGQRQRLDGFSSSFYSSRDSIFESL